VGATQGKSQHNVVIHGEPRRPPHLALSEAPRFLSDALDCLLSCSSQRRLLAIGVLKLKHQLPASADATIYCVTHFGLLVFETIGQDDARPVFLAGYRVFDWLNVGLANAGDPNGSSIPICLLGQVVGPTAPDLH
jgi:hypothetical protein